MANKMKGAMVDESYVLELDPQLWQALPQDLLERVITKLPFSRVVAFRTVCKRWHTDIIPRAAHLVQASSRSALLYFGSLDCYEEKPKGWDDTKLTGCPWWMLIFNSESEWAGSLKEFQQKSFPLPSNDEEVRLLICEQGLLFFGFVLKKTQMVRDIVVCNPLTSQSRSLGLPHPLRPPCEYGWNNAEVLVGAVFDLKRRSYRLVAAGLDGTGNYATLLYDSFKSVWTNGSSLLPSLLETGEGAIDLRTGSSRSVCCNGNLYWYTVSLLDNMEERQNVLKFDIQHDTWRLIPDLVVACHTGIGACQMALHEGEILLWHLHMGPYEDFYDPLEYSDWPCRSNRELPRAPEIKLMQRNMIERVDEFLSVQQDLELEFIRYLAFSGQHFIYHVMLLVCIADGSCAKWLKIVVQDTKENTYTELPLVQKERFPYHGFSPLNVWSFSASLTSLP